MKYNAFTSVERWIARRNEAGFEGRSTTLGVRVTSLARWLVVLALVLAAVWIAAFVVWAFGGLLVASAVGFVTLWAVPFVVVRGVVRVLEATEG